MPARVQARPVQVGRRQDRRVRLHRLGSPRRRLRLLVALVVVCALVLAGRLVQLQGFDSAHYASLAVDQRLRTIVLTAPRGEIVDDAGNPLAITVAAADIYAVPAAGRSPTAVARRLAPLLAEPASALARLLQARSFVYLARGVPPTVGAAVERLNLPGIGVLSTTRRDYPDGSLAANVIGAVGWQGTGLLGLELIYNRQLTGRPGYQQYQVSAGQQVVIPDAPQLYRPPVAGTGLMLTLNRDIQWEAQQAITAAVASTGSLSGTVIAMNPHTGALLAAATAPTFDPADLAAATPADLGDDPADDVYEPGSVNKVITMAAALQQGVITPDTPINVPAYLPYAGFIFHDAEFHGNEVLTAAGVLAVSSNIGAVQIARRLGAATMYRYLRAFGYGRSTDSGMPGEQPGQLPPLATWTPSTLPTVAYGQGIGVTALQVASVYATVANGGLRVTPHILAGTIAPNGVVHRFHYHAGPRLISAHVAAELRLMLQGVTTDQGTAPAAQIQGYQVAGKTGTASRPDGHGGYSGYTASFVGFVPAQNPQVLVEVVLQDPQRGYYGGQVAAPVFHTVTSFILQTLRIPPSGHPVSPPRIYAN
jgi:cell division protein FtsI (penicillin-binding protein 3)